MEQIFNILLGAIIASVVPIVTLIINQRKWKIEKKVELLRSKHDRLEVMYADILSKMEDALKNNLWPSDITSKVSVYASREVRDTYFDFIESKEKDEFKMKSFYLSLCLACNKHLAEIQYDIEANFK